MSLKHEEKLQLAIEEIKILSAVISDHDSISFQIRGWAITLNTAVIAGLFAKTVLFDNVIVFAVMTFTVLLFLWLDSVYKVAQDRAIKRSKTIEDELRKGILSEYPQIGLTLEENNNLKDQYKAIKNPRVIAPYIALILIDFIIVFFIKI